MRRHGLLHRPKLHHCFLLAYEDRCAFTDSRLPFRKEGVVFKKRAHPEAS
jgi:hypothetical protein